MTNHTPASTSSDVNICYHAVCLLDILGQGERLKDWIRLPDSGTLTETFIRALKETVGVVQGLSQQFQDLYDKFEQTKIPEAELPAGVRTTYARYWDCDLQMQQFADTFVFFSPIVNRYGDMTIIPLYRILAATASMCIVTLAAKKPIRGAITVGAGLRLENNGFYGPALAEAHYLEAKVADYPRILVSPNVIHFATPTYTFSDTPDIHELMRRLGQECQHFLCCDSDGQIILDFLGTAMRRLQGKLTETVQNAVWSAYRFAGDEAARFLANGDDKHAKRYERLVHYMESRLPIWEIPTEGAHHGE